MEDNSGGTRNDYASAGVEDSSTASPSAANNVQANSASSSPDGASGAKAKRPRASKSLLVSFKPGGNNNSYSNSYRDIPRSSADSANRQHQHPPQQQQQRVGGTPSLPSSSSMSSLSSLVHHQHSLSTSSSSMNDVALHGDRRGSIVEGGGQRQYALRRSRSNSNITSCIPAASRQEDWIWKRPAASSTTSAAAAAAAAALKSGDAAAYNRRLLLASLIDPPPEDEEEMVFLPHEKPSSRPAGASARPSPGSSLEAIAKDRHYAKGEKVPFDEDREHEFKQLHNVDKPVKRIADYCGKYINAFLNTNGGVCYFGIDDDGVVYGVHLSRSDRDAIRLHVDGIVESFWPAVDTRTCAIVFVPVADPCPKDTFVMELHVSKGTAPVYLMSKNKPTAYMRRSGSIYQMSMEMILQRMNFTMGSSGSVFQPLQNTLTYKLGNVPRNFVGRQTELEEILDQVEGSEDHVKVVSLYGQGGVGKTTLSRRIAAAMASAYPDGQFCIQLNGSTPNPIKTYDAMLYTIRAFHPSIAMPSSPTEVEGYYLSCFNQKRSVLLLDDAGSKEQVLSLLPKSTCLVIVTSRRSLGLDVEIGAVCVKKLGKLSLPEAIAMVQQMTRGKVTEEQAAQLAQLCGYLPLAVQVVSATLAKQSNLRPEAMIQRLTENKGEILRLEGNTVELCIKASFELLSSRLQHLFLPLSIFPGSFDEEAAARVLGVDAQTAQEALSEFLTNSLLEHNPVTWRYHLHFTVRVFSTVLAQKIEQEQTNAKSGSGGELYDEAPVNFTLWKERFILHYHDLMKRFQTLYKRGGDYVLSGLELFDQNKHNFEEAMRLSITEHKRYSLFCSFARAGQDIFRARFNQSKLMELYRDFLTAVKPDLIVTHRRGRRGLRSRNEQAALKATNADDEDQEQDEDDVDDAASPNSGTKTRRSSVITAAGESESDFVEDDDLVFVLNELGQAFAAQGQYHTAEGYYHHALRVSEKHSLNTADSVDTALPGLASSPTQSADEIGGSTGDLDISSVTTAVESAPIPIPRANSDFASASPPLGRAASWLPPPLMAAPGSLNASFVSAEHECKRWRGNLATTLHNLGKLYGEQCSYTAAIEHLQRALDLRQLMCGRDAADGRKPRGQETEGKKRMRRGMEDREMVGESMLALGACYTQLGKYDEAERQFKAVLSLYRPTTSSPLINAITRLSPPSELISNQQALSISSSTSPSLSSIMASLPTNLSEEIEVDEEMERQRLREELKLSKLGSTDSHGLQVAACLDHLGALLTIRGKYMEAFSLHSTSLGMKQKLLGSSHLEVARTRHYLAKVLGLAGRYKEAIQEYEVSLRIREDCLGPSHPLVANSLRHIAFLHFYTGEYTQAEKMYAKALKMLKDVFDRPHLEVAIVLNDLGLIYNHQSRYAKSQPLLRHSLAIRKKLLGKRHPYIAVVFNNLGNMYRKQRNYESAEKYLMKALTIREDCFGKEHPEVARSLHNIAALRMAQKRYPEAQALFQRSLEVRSKVLGHFHPELSAVHNAIGNLHECQKDLTGAIAHYNVALQLNRKAFGDYHPSISTNYYKLGNCYRLMKRYAEAEPMLQASRDVCFRCFGEEDQTSVVGQSRVSLDHRITPGHERILQSDDTLQKFYKEWAEYIVLQSREKRRLEDKSSAATAAADDEAAAAAEAEADRQRLKEARRRRRERRRKMKREGTYVKGEDDDYYYDDVEWYVQEEAKEEDEKFKRCIEVLKRMGREEDLAEVMRIEQRLQKLREHRRQRLEKERTEREAQRKASAGAGADGGGEGQGGHRTIGKRYSDDSDSDTSDDDDDDKKKKMETTTSTTKPQDVSAAAKKEAMSAKEKKPPLKKLTKNQRKQLMAMKLSGGGNAAGGGLEGETGGGGEHMKHKKRKWDDEDGERATTNETERASSTSLQAGTTAGQQQQQAVVVITVRHLVALVLALVTLPVSLLALYLYLFSSIIT